MTAFAKALFRAWPATSAEIDTIKTIGLFCGFGLVVSLLLAIAGLGINADIF